MCSLLHSSSLFDVSHTPHTDTFFHLFLLSPPSSFLSSQQAMWVGAVLVSIQYSSSDNMHIVGILIAASLAIMAVLFLERVRQQFSSQHQLQTVSVIMGSMICLGQTLISNHEEGVGLSTVVLWSLVLAFPTVLRVPFHQCQICLMVIIVFEILLQLLTLGKRTSWLVEVTSLLLTLVIFYCALVLAIKNDYDDRIRFYTHLQEHESLEQTTLLLEKMLPVQVAESLFSGRRYAKHHNSATVLFSNFGPELQELAGRDSLKMIRILDSMFNVFDLLTEVHQVYKVETVGTTYMVASGIPVEDALHANHAVRMALDMIDIMNEKDTAPNGEEGPESRNSVSGLGVAAGATGVSVLGRSTRMTADIDWDMGIKDIGLTLKIGVNTGSVISGVIGSKLPRFRLFGDTVNTASRMCSFAEPNTIQVTESTYTHIRGHFSIESLGTKNIKGKGLMNTYQVMGRDVKARHSLDAPSVAAHTKVPPPLVRTSSLVSFARCRADSMRSLQATYTRRATRMSDDSEGEARGSDQSLNSSSNIIEPVPRPRPSLSSSPVRHADRLFSPNSGSSASVASDSSSTSSASSQPQENPNKSQFTSLASLESCDDEMADASDSSNGSRRGGETGKKKRKLAPYRVEKIFTASPKHVSRKVNNLSSRIGRLRVDTMAEASPHPLGVPSSPYGETPSTPKPSTPTNAGGSPSMTTGNGGNKKERKTSTFSLENGIDRSSTTMSVDSSILGESTTTSYNGFKSQKVTSNTISSTKGSTVQEVEEVSALRDDNTPFYNVFNAVRLRPFFLRFVGRSDLDKEFGGTELVAVVRKSGRDFAIAMCFFFVLTAFVIVQIPCRSSSDWSHGVVFIPCLIAFLTFIAFLRLQMSIEVKTAEAAVKAEHPNVFERVVKNLREVQVTVLCILTVLNTRTVLTLLSDLDCADGEGAAENVTFVLYPGILAFLVYSIVGASQRYTMVHAVVLSCVNIISVLVARAELSINNKASWTDTTNNGAYALLFIHAALFFLIIHRRERHHRLTFLLRKASWKLAKDSYDFLQSLLPEVVIHEIVAILFEQQPTEVRSSLRDSGDSRMLSRNIQAMPVGSHCIAQRVPNATVIQADIVSFTPLCASLSPKQVVMMLDRLFSSIDAVTDKYDVYKVETIGDAYLAISGCPEPSATHTDNIVRFAVEMHRIASSTLTAHGSPITLRSGIHSGPVLAGVVGVSKMPRYHIFGETVSICEKIESSCSPGRIALSGSAAHLLKMDLKLVEGGTVAAHGVETTFFHIDESSDVFNEINTEEDVHSSFLSLPHIS